MTFTEYCQFYGKMYNLRIVIFHVPILSVYQQFYLTLYIQITLIASNFNLTFNDSILRHLQGIPIDTGYEARLILKWDLQFLGLYGVYYILKILTKKQRYRHSASDCLYTDNSDKQDQFLEQSSDYYLLFCIQLWLLGLCCKENVS